MVNAQMLANAVERARDLGRPTGIVMSYDEYFSVLANKDCRVDLQRKTFDNVPIDLKVSFTGCWVRHDNQGVYPSVKAW